MGILSEHTRPFREYIQALATQDKLKYTTATVKRGGLVFDIDLRYTVYYYEEYIYLQGIDGMIPIDATDLSWTDTVTDNEQIRIYSFRNGEQVIFQTATATSKPPPKHRGRPKKSDNPSAA